jgi:hypothetical protein
MQNLRIKNLEQNTTMLWLQEAKVVEAKAVAGVKPPIQVPIKVKLNAKSVVNLIMMLLVAGIGLIHRL